MTRVGSQRHSRKKRTLHVSDSSSVHHQESSTLYTAIGICHTGYADCLLLGSGWTLASCQQTCMIYTTAVRTVKKTPDDGQRTVRNMQSSIPKINLRNQCIQLVLLQEYITKHSPMNVKFSLVNYAGARLTRITSSVPKSQNKQQIKGDQEWRRTAHWRLSLE